MENPGIISTERLYKAADVARILNISRPLAYQLLQQGYIPVVRFKRTVRVRPIDLEEFIQRCRQEKCLSDLLLE